MVSVKNAEDKIRTFVEKDDFIKLKVELEKEIIRLKVDVNEIKSQIQRMKDKKNEKNSKNIGKTDCSNQVMTERFKQLQKKLECAATAIPTTTREDSKIAKGKEKKRAKRNKMRKKKKKNENSKNNE